MGSLTTFCLAVAKYVHTIHCHSSNQNFTRNRLHWIQTKHCSVVSRSPKLCLLLLDYLIPTPVTHSCRLQLKFIPFIRIQYAAINNFLTTRPLFRVSQAIRSSGYECVGYLFPLPRLTSWVFSILYNQLAFASVITRWDRLLECLH